MPKPIKYSALILFVLLISGLTSVIVSVSTSSALDRYITRIAQESQLVSLSSERNRPLPGSYEQALELVAHRSVPAVAGLVEGVLEGETWTVQPDFFASGAVITSDGWIAFRLNSTSVETLEGGDIWIDGNFYSVEEVRVSALMDIAMVKIDAKELEVVTFASVSEMFGGEFVFLKGEGIEVAIDRIVNPYFEAEPVDAALYPFRIVMDSQKNGPVFNSAGELLGIASSGNLMPIGQEIAVIQSLIRNSDYEPIVFGAVTEFVEEIGGQMVGERVIGRPTGFAQVAGVQSGDVLVEIEDFPVTRLKPVSVHLLSYKLGDSVNLVVVRDGEEIELTAEFSENE